MKIRWQATETGTDIYLDNQKIGTAVSQENAEDRFVQTEEGVICWTRITKVPISDMSMRFEVEFPLDYSMIPALQYDGNECAVQDYIDVRNDSLGVDSIEKKEAPTFFHGQRESKSGLPWRFAWHRMSVPGALYIEGGGQAAGGFLPPGQQNGACSLYEDEDKACTVLQWLWPEQEGPLPVFTGGEWHENYQKSIEPRNEFTIMLVFASVKQPRQSWKYLLEAAWKQYYTARESGRTDDNLWELGISYAKQLYTEEADGFKGFSIGFTWEHDKWVKRPVQKYEIGWCGQNASLANSLLIHAGMTGEQDAADMALAVLDAWLSAAGPTGLIPTHYDDNMYTNGHAKTIDACNLGTAAVQLFEAQQNAAALGIERVAYGEMARRICNFAVEVMDASGRIGKSWLEADLTPAVSEGGTGAFLTMALCEGALVERARVEDAQSDGVQGERSRIAGSQDMKDECYPGERYLEAAKRSHAYYMGQLRQNGYTTGGALDILSIDKESCIPLLKSSLLLYELSGERSYLEDAELAAWYLSTWQWHYTKPFAQDSLLGQLNYDTFGGTAVSIHGGMDPFALCYVHELCDLTQATGREQWQQRASAIWRHGQQGISDGDLVLDGKAARPRGSQDESCNYTYGRGEGRPTQWLVAWPAAFRLEALRKMLPERAQYKERIL